MNHLMVDSSERRLQRPLRRRCNTSCSSLLLLTLSGSFLALAAGFSVQSNHYSSITTRRRPSPQTSPCAPQSISLATPAFTTTTATTASKRSTLTPRRMILADLAEGYNYCLAEQPLITASLTAGCLSGLGDVIAQLQHQYQQQQLSLTQQQPQEQSLSSPLLPSFLEAEEQVVSTLPQQQAQLLPVSFALPFTTTANSMLPSFHIDTERTRRFVAKGLGGGLIWLAWYHLADELTHRLLYQTFADEGMNLMTLLMTVGAASATAAGDLVEPTAASAVAGQDTSVLAATVVASSALAVPATVTIGRTVLSILLDQFLASPIIIALWEIPVPILLSREEDTTKIPTEVHDKLGGLLLENAKVWTLANAIIYNLPFEYRVLASSCADVLWQAILSHYNNSPSSSTSSSVREEELLLEYEASHELVLPTTSLMAVDASSSMPPPPTITLEGVMKNDEGMVVVMEAGVAQEI